LITLPTKNKKIAIIVSILLIAGSLGYLAFGNFGENIVYFVTPSEVKAFTPETYKKKVRVGGMVVKGSLKTQPELQRRPRSCGGRPVAGWTDISFDHDHGQTFRRLHAHGAKARGRGTPQKRFYENSLALRGVPILHDH
jgi:hypothetical protein